MSKKINKKTLTSNIIFITLLLIILVVALLMRSVEIINHNYIFEFDQGRDYLYVKEMVENLKPRLIGVQSGVQGMFHGPLYLYMLSIFYLLFKGDPYGGLVMAYLTGLLTLGVFYFLFYKLFDKWIALFGLFLLAISPSLAFFSRVMWNPHFIPLFVIITYYFTYLIPNKKNVYFPLAVFFATLTYNFEIAVTVPLLLSLFIYSLLVLRIRTVKTYILGILSFILGLFPFVLFETRHSFNGIKGTFEYLHKFSEGGGLPVLAKLQDQLPSYWYAYRDVIPHRDTSLAVFLMIVFVLFTLFISVFFLKSQKVAKLQKKLFIFLYIVLLLTIITNVLLIQGALWVHYLPHIGVTFLCIFTFVFAYVLRTNNIILKLSYGIFILIFTFLSIININTLWRAEYFDYGKTAKIKGKVDAIDYIYQDVDKKPFSAFVFMAPIYTYPYDYLFNWYGKKKYSFIPDSKKEGLFYLLIVPDTSQPWTYQGWKETVIKSGQVQWTKTLPSGIIIEKRIGTESAMLR